MRHLLLFTQTHSRRELRLDDVDSEVRAVWNAYKLFELYQENKDKVSLVSNQDYTVVSIFVVSGGEENFAEFRGKCHQPSRRLHKI